MVSVFGPPGSGKTTVSVALAEQIAEKGYNVCIVCCEDVVPTIPTLLPQTVSRVNEVETKVRSIGKILNSMEFSAEDILQQCVYSKKYRRIVLIGYTLGENRNTYPTPTDYDIYAFYSKLSTMVDYIIVDCASDILSSGLSRVGIANSDTVIRLAGGSYKDVVYYASVMPSLPEGNVKKENYIVVFPKVQKNDVIDDLVEFYGRIDFKIKFFPSIQEKQQYGEYFEKEFPSQYKDVIKKILEIVNFS